MSATIGSILTLSAFLSPAALSGLQPSPKLIRMPTLSAMERMDMVHRPAEISSFEFVVLSGLRTAQLTRGCTPRVEGNHKRVTIAQLEVASGKVIRAAPIAVAGPVAI